MNIDYSPRQSGKTTKMIEWLKEDPQTRYLITFSGREEFRLHNEYPELKHRIFYWETWIEIKKKGGLSGGHSTIGVDNADYILERMFGNYIAKASFTKEEIDLR